MFVMSHRAIFLWLFFTYTAADFIKNGNENANGTEKSNRTALHSGTEYKESKRFRQHRLNTTEEVDISTKNSTMEAQTQKIDTNRNRHSIKTKHKHKRMWHDLSSDQKNNTKTLDANKTSDTKELIKSSVNDTNSLTNGDDQSNENNKSERRINNSKSNETVDDKVKQINTVINDKTNVSNEDTSDKSQLRSKIQRVRVDNSSTPTHRKKRRRILFSSTQSVPIDTPQTVSYMYNHFQPLEQNFPQDHIVPFLDFGRKIAGAPPRGNVNFVDSLLTEIRTNVKPPVESKSQISEEELHEDMDVTVDRKTIEKNHVPNDRLHVASTNLANYYRRPTTKPNITTTNTSSLCLPSYRIRRPFIGNKTLKREIIQNSTLCQLNVTTAKPEDIRISDKPEIKKFLKNRTDSTTYKSSTKSDNQVTESSRIDITTPLVNQLTTKILSTAVITSVSVKSNDDSLVQRPLETYPLIDEKLEESRKKSKSDKLFDDTYSSSGVVFSALNKNKTVQSTLRPSLTFYQRNASKNFRNLNRNSQLSKLLSQLQSHAVRSTFNTTRADNNTETNTKQNVPLQPKTTFNISDPNIEYLHGSNPTTEPVEPESELAETDITTNDLFNQKPTVVIVTVNEKESVPLLDINSSSTPSLITKNTENWRYHTNVENISLPENSTFDSNIYAIFSQASVLNFTRVESTTSLPPKFATKSVTAKPNSEELGNGYHIGFHIVTYVLAGLGIIPLVIGIFLITKMILSQNKKQIFEGSEYSSEYNRNPLEFNGGVTSSPIATKLPRVPHHMAHWEIEKKTFPSISLPNNSKWEFPRDKLRLQTILGQGNFGQVWKAEADDISGHEGLTRLVAVKMVKEISSTREKEDLIRELVIMQHLGSHPNVVTLLGCCTEKEPYMLIMEYVMYGKLLSFLRDHRTRSHYFNFSDNGDTLTSRDLTVFAYCVARGMEYLQNKQVIHRDLAARNILVDHNKLCKIADFGMSRHVGESGQVLEHRQSKGALPIRWMAPESLHYSCYTHKTDVWSFGILMWEIVTLGSMPYASMGARVVMRKVKEGYRLEKPKHCKSQLFNIISKCWYSDPNKRPTFTELKQDLANLLEDPEHVGNYVDLDSLVEEMNQVVHGSHNEKIII